MPEEPDGSAVYEVVCPHCGKTFAAEPMTGAAARYRGFKCPHCRLIVAFDRVGDRPEPNAAPK